MPAGIKCYLWNKAKMQELIRGVAEKLQDKRHDFHFFQI